MLLAVQRVELADRLSSHTNPVLGLHQTQLDGHRHLLIEGHSGESNAVAPADLDAASVGCVAVGLGGVEIAVPKLVPARVGFELAAVELAEDILAISAMQHPLAFASSFHRQFEDVRAFKETLDAALEFPDFQVA